MDTVRNKSADVGSSDTLCSDVELEQAIDAKPPRIVITVKRGEVVSVIHRSGIRCGAIIYHTADHGITLAFTRTRRVYFPVSSEVTIELKDGVIIYARVFDNRRGLLKLRKLQTRE